MPASNFHFLKKSKNFLLSNDGSLKKKVFRGTFWVFLIRFIERLFEVLRTIILARLLAPKDFGELGIALLAISSLENLSNTGIDQALIQKKSDINKYLNTAWSIQIIRGCSISIILFISAPLIGAFFHEEGVVYLIRALSFSELIKAFTHIGVVFFHRDLTFIKQFIFQFFGITADLLISIPIAIIFRTPWALVFGLIAGNIVRLLLSFFISQHHLSFSINKKYAKDLLNYGKYVFFQSILFFILLQGDDVFIGRYFGVAILGIYQLGYRISNLAATELTRVIATIMFPAYSKIQNNKLKLREVLLFTTKTTSLITFPICGGIFILAPEFTTVFLGEQWLKIIPIIQILSVEGLMRSVTANFGSIYKATSHLKIETNINLIQLFTLLILIWPLSYYYNIVGACIAVTLMLAIGLFFSTIEITKLLHFSVIKLYSSMLKPLAFSIIMVGFMFLFKKYILINANVTNFLALSLIGSAVYLIINLACNKSYLKQVVSYFVIN